MFTHCCPLKIGSGLFSHQPMYTSCGIFNRHKYCRFFPERGAFVLLVILPEFGHRPVAFLKLTNYYNLQCQYMIKRLEEMLPCFKIPYYFFPLPGELDSDTLKPDRKLLKEIAEDLIQMHDPG